MDAGVINVYGNHWIPSPGYAYLSNGEVWTDGLFLGRTDSIDRWHETNEEPPNLEDEEDVV